MRAVFLALSRGNENPAQALYTDIYNYEVQELICSPDGYISDQIPC